MWSTCLGNTLLRKWVKKGFIWLMDAKDTGQTFEQYQYFVNNLFCTLLLYKILSCSRKEYVTEAWADLDIQIYSHWNTKYNSQYLEAYTLVTYIKGRSLYILFPRHLNMALQACTFSSAETQKTRFHANLYSTSRKKALHLYLSSLLVRKFIHVKGKSNFLYFFSFRIHRNTQSANVSMDDGLGIIPSFVLKLKSFPFVWNNLIPIAPIKRNNSTI